MAELLQPNPEVLAIANGQELTPISIFDLDKRHLRVGQFIVDLPSLASFNTVESAVCGTLTPFDTVNEVDAVLQEPSIMNERVAEVLRPGNLSVKLSDSFAAILPFTLEVAAEHSVALKKSVENRSLQENRPGLRLLFGGHLRNRQLGEASFMYTAVYYRRHAKRSLLDEERGALTRVFKRPLPELTWHPVIPKPPGSGERPYIRPSLMDL